jgi:hypothetical protein
MVTLSPAFLCFCINFECLVAKRRGRRFTRENVLLEHTVGMELMEQNICRMKDTQPYELRLVLTAAHTIRKPRLFC